MARRSLYGQEYYWIIRREFYFVCLEVTVDLVLLLLLKCPFKFAVLISRLK